MKKIGINLNKIKQKEIDFIADYFKRGQVVIYPTDTVYGLGCLANNKKAINKIYRVKQRDRAKPLLILISGFKMLKKYCYVSEGQLKYLKRVWPGPVSVILKSKGVLPRELTGGRDSLAVRLPKNGFLIKIITKVNLPLVSTSVNISGRRSPDNLDNLAKYFKQTKPNLVINAGKIGKLKPSKLVDLRDVENVRVLRR